MQQLFDFLNDIAPLLCGGVALAILVILLISAIDRHKGKTKR